jgi:hypothetical protein
MEDTDGPFLMVAAFVERFPGQSSNESLDVGALQTALNIRVPSQAGASCLLVFVKGTKRGPFDLETRMVGPGGMATDFTKKGDHQILFQASQQIYQFELGLSWLAHEHGVYRLEVRINGRLLGLVPIWIGPPRNQDGIFVGRSQPN